MMNKIIIYVYVAAVLLAVALNVYYYGFER
jgi:hypothetical protein